MKSNAFNVVGGKLAQYLKMCRMNHDCMPNACPTGDDGIVVRAVRPIKKGQEITISYIDSVPHLCFATAAKRQEVLMKHYRFTCDCQACKNQVWSLNLESFLIYEFDCQINV